MCNFLSVLILKNGDVRHHPMLDSHSDLVAYFNLPDENPHVPYFAKAELTPKDWMDPATWTWRIDEAVRPIWLDDVEPKAEAATRRIASKMILREDAMPRLIVDGCWILGGTSVLRDVRGGRIIRVQDAGTISHVSGGTISDVSGGTISHVSGGTISHVRGGTISDVSGGTIRHVSGGTIRDVSGGTISDGRGGTHHPR